MSIRYSDDFKKEVVKAYMAGDKSTVQIAADYNIAKSTISQWVNQYKEECLYTTNTTPESNEAREIRRLNWSAQWLYAKKHKHRQAPQP